MKKRSLEFTLGATVFAICTILFGLAGAATITVGSLTTQPGGQATVPVYLESNDIGIASLTVPLRYSGSALSIDSVSFVGSLLKPGMSGVVNNQNAEQEVRITYIPTSGLPVITETDGLLAMVYFAVAPGTEGSTIYIDSVNRVESIGSVELWTRLEIADDQGMSLIFPEFEGGIVWVQSPLDADDDPVGLPKMLDLKQNYPNPFNPATTIAYSLPERSRVTLRIFNILGQEVQTLVDETKPAGDYEIEWQSGTNASGLYFYRLTFDGKVLTKKMTLLK